MRRARCAHAGGWWAPFPRPPVGAVGSRTRRSPSPDQRRGASSIRRLTDQRILSVQPARVTVATVPRDVPFRTLVDARRLPRGMTVDDLAILNGVQVDAVVPAGTRLKLPR
jgi:predicted Zn-dependent protease